MMNLNQRLFLALRLALTVVLGLLLVSPLFCCGVKGLPLPPLVIVPDKGDPTPEKDVSSK